MSILTEHIVLSRTRAQDLNSVRKLNCWGSELSDVSIVRRMSFVEVLSLSVNNITTLADFAYCRNLQELYLRKNNIKDLNEVCYLQILPRLHSLWLADNPCAERSNYRLTVLRALPNLQKLDNIFVQPDEVGKAKSLGDSLQNPEEALNPATEQNSQIVTSPSYPIQDAVIEYCQERIEVEPEPVIKEGVYHYAVTGRLQDLPQNYSESNGSTVQTDTPSFGSRRTLILSEEDEQTQMITSVHMNASGSSQGISPQHQHAFHARVQTLVDHSGRRLRKATDLNIDSNVCGTLLEEQSQAGDGSLIKGDEVQYNNDPDDTASSGDGYRHAYQNGDFRSPQNEYPNYMDMKGAMGMTYPQRSEKGSPARYLPKGGKNRNSNILSAVLCLVKELDYASLEVVETAIHCRMEEMDD